MLIAAVALGVGLAHLGVDVRGGLLSLCPALLLAVVLYARRYPGERVIERWRAKRASTAPRRSLSAPQLRPRLCARRGGGRLIAVSLAGRAPPLAAGC